MQDSRAESLDQVLVAIAEHRESVSAAERLVQDAQAALARFLSSLTTRPDRELIAAVLYWTCPDLHATQLATLAGARDVSTFIRTLQPFETAMCCEQCDAPLLVTSRTEWSELQRLRRRRLCVSCRDVIVQDITLADQQQRSALNARRRELRLMPYHDYLATQEWQMRRQRKLVAAEFACQLCGATARPLQVHHRTYARRGNERDVDLIVLCGGPGGCHGRFHGK